MILLRDLSRGYEELTSDCVFVFLCVFLSSSETEVSSVEALADSEDIINR